MIFPNFYGNAAVAEALANMIRHDRIPQTILLAGSEGVGKATLARRFAAALLGDAEKIELDDLSLPEKVEHLAEREKLPSDKRADDPLLYSSHPDFVTFPPDGPLRQISIQQMRLLKDRAQFAPIKGRYRVFLIDHLDRANEQAANSLLKITEEPPDHLILILTAQNVYDLLPTIRSRSLIFHLNALTESEMLEFASSRGWATAVRGAGGSATSYRIDPAHERRIALAAGAPGLAVTLDIEAWDKRRQRMVALLEVASGIEKFSGWVKHSETISASKTEKLDTYLLILYGLLEDILLLREGSPARRNADLTTKLQPIAVRTSFEWLEAAVERVDELVEFARRNIQKGIALDAFAVDLRRRTG